MATVEIYTKATCGFCVRAKRLLDMKKVEYREIAVDRGGAPQGGNGPARQRPDDRAADLHRRRAMSAAATI